MTDLPMHVRLAREEDIDNIVEVHMSAFPGFFMTHMGRTFLHVYYLLVLKYDRRLVFVAEADGKSYGFVAGFLDPECFYTFMSKHKKQMAWPIIRGLLRRPMLAGRVLYNRRHVEAQVVASGAGLNIAELSSIGVDSRAFSHGVGSALLNAFLEGASNAGVKIVTLTTDAHNNERVNAFYLKHGFKIYRTYISGPKRLMNEYRIQLP